MTGNALYGTDYVMNSAPDHVVIPAGYTSVGIVLSVTTSKTKGKQKATMTLSAGSGYELPTEGKKHKIKPPKATVTINNK